MKYSLIVKVCPYMKNKLAKLWTFASSLALVPEDGTTIIISDKESEEFNREAIEELVDLVPTRKAIVLKFPIYRNGLAIGAITPYIEDCELNLFAGGVSGEALAVRASTRIGGCSFTEAESGTREGSTITIKKKAYSGNIEATYELVTPPYFISIDRTVKEAELKGYEGEKKINRYFMESPDPLRATGRTIEPREASDPLEDAKVVLAMGRGVGNKDTAEKVCDMAEEIGAASGCTRPVVMNAWLPKDKQIGVSGSIISPEVCIVAGAGGSPAFYEGISGSGTIIAIDTDEKSPMLKKADAAIVGDLGEVLPKLVEEITKNKK